MEEEKIFTFTEYSADRPPKAIRKKESELSAADKAYLLGELIHRFNHNTRENQDKFLRMIVEDYEEKHYNKEALHDFETFGDRNKLKKL